MRYATYTTFKRQRRILVNLEKISTITDTDDTDNDDFNTGCYIRLDNGNDIRVQESYTEVTEDFKDFLDTRHH